MRRRPVTAGVLIQHIDGRQGRVEKLQVVEGLPGALVRWFNNTVESLPLGYIFTTNIEETE